MKISDVYAVEGVTFTHIKTDASYTGGTTYEVYANGVHIGFVSSWKPNSRQTNWWDHLAKSSEERPGYAVSRAQATEALYRRKGKKSRRQGK